MIFSTLSVTCLVSMAVSLKNSLLTAIFIVAPQKASLISGMARISPIWTNRPPSVVQLGN